MSGLLIDEITPRIVTDINARKEEIIAASGGTLSQIRLRVSWPVAIDLMPGVLHSGYLEILRKAEQETIADLMSRILADIGTLKLMGVKL